MSWLSSVQDWATNAAKGDGVVIAIVLAALSGGDRGGGRCRLAAEAVPGAGGCPESPLLGGRSGLRRHPSGRRDRPNAGLLFVLFAYTMYALVPYEQPAPTPRGKSDTREIAVTG